MRLMSAALCLGLLAACDAADAPKPAAAERAMKQDPRMAAAWPLLLQHCLRSPSCDPMGEVGDGAGEASGLAGSVPWLAQTADVVAEGGADYGAALRLSLVGSRGQGGVSGRPMTTSEMPATLRARRDRNSWVTVEYRLPGGGEPEAYFLSVQSALLALPVPGAASAKSRDGLSEMTADWLDSLVWPDGETGARIEIAGKSGVLFRAYSSGLSGDASQTREQVLKQGYEPWVIYASRNLRDDPLPDLMAALMAGEALSLKITAPDGGAILSDALYARGFDGALMQAHASLDDPAIATPIGDRCARFASEPDAFWKIADVTAALRACDPRTPEQAAAAER